MTNILSKWSKNWMENKQRIKFKLKTWLVSIHVFIINYTQRNFLHELFGKKKTSFRSFHQKCCRKMFRSWGPFKRRFRGEFFVGGLLSITFALHRGSMGKQTISFFIPFSCHYSWLFHVTIVGG